MCYMYAVTFLLLNHGYIGKHPEIRKTEHFIGQYNWRETKFHIGIKDWKMFETNKKTIALKILFFYQTMAMKWKK